MNFMSKIIPHTVYTKAGLRTKRRMPFILCTDLLGFLVAISMVLYAYIKNTIWYVQLSFAGVILLCTLSVLLLRSGKFAFGAYLCSAGLFFLSTAFAFLLPVASLMHVLYNLIVCYAIIGSFNFIIAIRRRQLFGFFIGAIVALIIFFTAHFSLTDAVQRSALFLCAAGIAATSIAHFFIYTLNEGIYKISNAHTVEAQNSLERMKDLVEKVKDSVEFSVTLGDASEKLDSAVKELQKVYQYLQGQSDSWEKISDGLKHSFDTVLEKMQNMTEIFGNQNDSINQSSSVLSNISQHIDTINSVASQRRDGMHNFVQKYEAQNTHIKDLINTVELLRSSSQGIMSFTHVVEHIASQTGVLAMNASIEASHAGQFGKGFGVIAQEIRALSGETTKTARKIAEMLNDNNKIVETAVTSFDQFTEETKQQIHESHAIINSIDSIIQAIREMGKDTQTAMHTADSLQATAKETRNRIEIISNQISEQRASVSEFASILATINAKIQSFISGVQRIKEASVSVAETGLKNRKIVGSINASLRKVYGPVHIPWHDGYKVGIATIDNQHRHLFEIADVLYGVITSGKEPPKAAVKELLDQLAEYVVMHFSHEEDLMNDTQYPASGGHKKAHVLFTDAVKKVIEDFSNGKKIDLEELYAFISDWLVEHIILVDRSLGAYLNTCTGCANVMRCKEAGACIGA